MNETELLARLRAEVPLEDVSPEAERLFLAGLEPAPGHPRGTWRRAGRSPLAGRLALAGGLSAALAAAAALVLAAVSATAPPPAGPGVSPQVRELAYRVAAVAGQQPQVSPGQWVDWKEARLEDGATHDFEVWTTADHAKAAFVASGTVYPVHFPALGKNLPRAKQFIGQPEGFVIPAAHGGGTDFTGLTGTILVPYAGLGALPGSPEALDRYLAGLAGPDVGIDPAPVREFDAIEDMITSYVMPPQLTAELYRALGAIPGVTLDNQAVDVAGRPGIGLISPAYADSSASEIIVNPRTYQLTGDSTLGDGHTVSYGSAILSEALVSGPGVRP
jgi:hypothetical protein